MQKPPNKKYPSYIFALAMGTGKTILMATCIFYEFLLANKFPKDPKYCHNALVFAPDKTVLQSLKEIQTFDMRKVVPSEYVNFLSTHIKFHFLEESGTALSTIDRSRFNIIISNTQKIILKRQHKEESPDDKLFRSGKPTYKPKSVYDEFSGLYEFDTPEDDKELTINQRFIKLSRLEQLGIYVDEAHHAFGNQLERDMGIRKTKTSLRLTIDELAANLERAGTHVVACYNFTGTPYIGKYILPEVVYGYGIQEAIDKGYLKKVVLHSYTNPRTDEFVRHVVTDFWENHRGQRYEGMLPKIALFAATIDELQNDLRPAVEDILSDLQISHNKILVNVGDEKITSNDELREFINLDSSKSEKQFILLVNKGREGWNCRSLFGVALYRRPKSKIFVLQASMRCLRSIGKGHQSGHIYLSEENMQILDDELQQNFRLNVDDIQNVGKNRKSYKVRVTEPPVKITLKRIKRLYQVKEKEAKRGFSLELDKVDTDQYRLIHTQQEGLSIKDTAISRKKWQEDLTDMREKRVFSVLTLVAEISRYLNRPSLEIEEILEKTKEGIDEIVKSVNEFNEILYDWIIPRLFRVLYELNSFERKEEEEIELIKRPDEGYYIVSAKPQLVVENTEPSLSEYLDKSFHVDTYCFQSNPEMHR